MTVYSLADELWQEAMVTRQNAHPWDNIPASRTAFVVVDMKKYFVQQKSSGEENSSGKIAAASNAWCASFRENWNLVIRIPNTSTDTWDTRCVRCEPKSSKSARYRIAAVEFCAKEHKHWPIREPHATDAFLTKKLHSALGPGSKRAATSVCQ